MWITTPPIFGFAARFIRGWTSSMSIVVPMYGATLLAAWALTEARERRARQLREARLELQLQAARLEALRAQLRPHFLFNTLNSISALVADAQRDRATHALDQLADLLHASYRDDGAGMIPLGDEIALAGQYLALQQLRFADRLQHEIHVSPEAARSLVPALILQPLVENAVIHGLALRDGPMRVGIDARLREGALVVTIDNDGRDLPAGWQPKRTEGGVGLTNTRARIESAYGRDANLTVRPRPSGGARAVLSIRVAVPSSPIHSARREATEPA
jgi:sensor histidine kinase YesM